MDLGVFMFATDEAMEPGALARALEDRRFESLFLPEHTHIPVSRATRHPHLDGAIEQDIRREYARTYDLFVALTAAACATTTLKVGTGACLVVERDPIVTAKEVASVDRLSGGRFLFGVGGGWNREEMRNHGTEPRTRLRLLGEWIEAMKAIWTQDEAEYHGEFVDFDPIWCWPKPVQQPHPPVLIGGWGPTTFDRVLAYGDGWMPVRGQGDDLATGIADLQRRAAETGRRRVPVTVFGAEPTAAGLEELTAAGADRAVFVVPTGPADVVLPLLDLYAPLVGSA